MEDKDLNNINEIDMECSCYDDDDSFGEIKIKDSSDADFIDSDDRNYQRKTDIILDFNDTDDNEKVRKISVDLDTNSNGLKVDKNFKSNYDLDNMNSEDINAIDMETDYFDDEDEDLIHKTNNRRKISRSMFDDFDNEKELIDNDLFEAKKSKVTTGDVEADYWEKLSKKHAASNKKGAYNTHFHLAGNPKLEMELFNHDMKVASDSYEPIKTGGLADNGMDLDGNISISGEASGNICGVSSAGGEGVSESLNEDINFADLQPIFDITGFTIIQMEDASFKAIDNCGIEPDIDAVDIKDLLDKLSPYINDCFIFPLQIASGENFKTYDDWVNWYTDDKAKEFPRCKSDIACCKVISKYLK